MVTVTSVHPDRFFLPMELDTKWITSGDLTAGATALVGVTNTTTNATHYLTFVDTASGQENIRVDTDLTYNPSTNTLNAGTFNSTSDITLKENVSIIDNALDMINNLEGISWNWKERRTSISGCICSEC